MAMHNLGFALFVITAFLALAAGKGRAIFGPRNGRISLSASSANRMSFGVSDAKPWSMQGIVTLLILVAALYIILSQKFPPDAEKWAFGVIGTILGFWLNSK